LIQKSILRDGYNDLSLHFLAKLDIMVVTDVERNDVDFIARTLKLLPVAHVDHFSPEKLGSAALVEEVTIAGSNSRVVKMTGIVNMGRTITILMRGSNKLVLDEADRSIHDALCVVRSLVKKRFLISGGGSPEAECSLRLSQWAKTLTGIKSYCVRAFAEVIDYLPFLLL
jgi:T-complex protein 1 subunit delta